MKLQFLDKKLDVATTSVDEGRYLSSENRVLETDACRTIKSY
jgi:hypothetical protein